MVNVGIVGSRARTAPEDKERTRVALLELLDEFGKENVTIVSGGCPDGADQFAEQFAAEYGLPKIIHHPDKSKLRAKARWAYAEIYHARNTFVARDAEVLIAVINKGKEGGTEHCVREFLKMGKKRLVIIE